MDNFDWRTGCRFYIGNIVLGDIPWFDKIM